MSLPGRRLDKELAQVGADQKEREENFLLTAKVITDETFSRHEGFDLAIFDKSNLPLSNFPKFHVLKRGTYSVFKSTVANHFGYSEKQIRLWVVANRQNKTTRVITHIPEGEPSLSMLCGSYAECF